MESLSRSVKSLALAVWCLCALSVVWLAFYAWAWFRPPSFGSQITDSGSYRAPARSEIEESDFDALPPEKKIERSSVILVTQFKRDGGRMKSVITEILKKRPDTRFYYSVGDEFAEGGGYIAGTEKYDGDVVFLTGNPARMRYATTYSNDRTGGFGDLTLPRLRQLVAQSK